MSSGNAPGSGYAEVGYWNKRYEQSKDSPTPFEWYRKFDEFEEHYLKELVSGSHNRLRASPRNSQIDFCFQGDAKHVLHVGNGNSAVPVDAVAALPEQTIVALDYSDVVTQQMQEKYGETERVTFCQGDCTTLADFEDATFDAAFDKGTLDAIVCGTRSVKDSTAYMLAAHRVLKPGAKLFILTFGAPDTRLEHLHRAPWTSVEHSVVGQCESTTHHLYVCKK